VISQILCKRIPKGRVALHDILINTPSIAALIRDNKTFRIPSDQQTGTKYGMITLDENLFQKYQDGVISREDCMDKSADYQGMMQRLKEYDEQQALLAEEEQEMQGAA
jgi:twitching motility protein PilT